MPSVETACLRNPTRPNQNSHLLNLAYNWCCLKVCNTKPKCLSCSNSLLEYTKISSKGKSISHFGGKPGRSSGNTSRKSLTTGTSSNLTSLLQVSTTWARYLLQPFLSKQLAEMAESNLKVLTSALHRRLLLVVPVILISPPCGNNPLKDSLKQINPSQESHPTP